MTSPPTISTTRGRSSQAPTRDSLVRAAHEHLDARGVQRSPSWINKAVRSYRHVGTVGRTLGSYLDERLEADRRAIGYADPVGETAVRNVMRGGQ